MYAELTTALFAIFLMATSVTIAQTQQQIRKHGYTLTIQNTDPTFDITVADEFSDTFFKVYPRLAREFNVKTVRSVTFLIDTAYNGVAEAGGGTVRVSAKWFHRYPKDIDVITHEVMHLVQDYPSDAVPGWITEGIADFVRFEYGVANTSGGWALPPYAPDHHYTDSYRITARFFVWIEKRVKRRVVKALDSAARSKTYNHTFWTTQTGRSIDELWRAYTLQPAI